MKKIVVVNGIHARANEGGTHRIAQALRAKGYDVREYAYPRRWAFMLWSKSIRERDARGLMRFCESDGTESIISHSNGCLITQDAIRLGLKLDSWFAIAGACSSDKVEYPSNAFEYAYAIYNPYDIALKFGALLPNHPFGRLGSEGYRGYKNGQWDSRWKNINGAASGYGLNHSHYFDRELEQWASFIESNIIYPRSKLSIRR